MSMKEFDKLEEKITRLVASVKQLKDENQALKKDLSELQSDSSQYTQERNELKKKVTALLELVDAIPE
jgi:FtsZ-binding cell division protein ZapB